MYKHFLVISVATLCIAGCSTELRVWNESGVETRGVPIKMVEAFVKEGTYTKFAKDATIACKMNDSHEVVVLPLGDTYFVNVDSNGLAKAGFSISFHENGSLAGISMNSDLAAGVKAATESLEALLPFIGVLPSDDEGSFVPAKLPAEGERSATQQDHVDGGSEDTSPKPLCDSALSNVTYTPFSKYRRFRIPEVPIQSIESF